MNDFRRVSLEMMDGRREKLTGNQDNLVGRIEFLPVLWHGAVHDDMPTGVDRCVKCIFESKELVSSLMSLKIRL